MIRKTAKKIIKKAIKNRDVGLLRDKQYIRAQLGFDWLGNLSIQMGPNCNKACRHCYGDYGPHRYGLPDPDLVEKAVRESRKAGITTFTLTDGEPLRSRNKEVLEKILGNRNPEVPIAILTNGSFANTDPNTIKWMRFLGDNGINFVDENGDIMCVSFGPVYDVHWHNYCRINFGLKEFFPDADFGNVLTYRLMRSGHKDERRSLNQVFTAIASAFCGRDVKLEFGEGRENSRGNNSYFLPVKNGTSMEIVLDRCDPMGRARNIKVVREGYPEKKYTLNNLNFRPETIGSIWLKSNGDVSWGYSESCIKKGKIYGNIREASLSDLKERILDDSVYQGFRLGGVRFLYHMARQVGEFKGRGRIKCDVCHDIFGDPELIQGIRERLGPGGHEGLLHLVDVYREYLDETGKSLKIR